MAGSVWKGGAYYFDSGTFGHCTLSADFPEGWTVAFRLEADRSLIVEFDEPGNLSLDVAPSLSVSVDGQRIASVPMAIDEDMLWMADWLIIAGNLGRIEEVGAPLKAGSRLTMVLDGPDSDGRQQSWTFSASLSGSSRAFGQLEACIAKHGGPAPPAGSSPSGRALSGSHADTRPASLYGAIAVGEYDSGLAFGLSTDTPSYAEAESAAVESCNGTRYAGCTVRMYLEPGAPCGAIAGGNDSDGVAVAGWARRSTEADAKVGALESCSEIGYGCQVSLSGCNSH